MKKVGYGIFLLAGLWMWIAEIIAFTRWWDLAGTLIAIFVPPVAVALPFVYWVKEGIFPLMYFIVWGLGIGGVFLASQSPDF